MTLGAHDFERWWPEVSRRLTRTLTRRGLAAPDADDVVQETALRALATDPPVSSPEELARWSFTVARRIEIDRARCRGRADVVPIDTARLPADRADVARTAEHRMAWTAAVAGLSTLSDGDRAALLGVLADDEPVPDRRAAVREAVRRHRARARLVAAVGRLVGVGTAAWQGLRRVAGRFQARPVEMGLAMAVGVLLLPTSTPPSTAEAAAPPAAAAAPVPAPPGGAPPTSVVPAKAVASRGSPAVAPAPVAAPVRGPSVVAPASPPGPGRTVPLPVKPPCHCHGALPTLDVDGRQVDLNDAVWCTATTDVGCARRSVDR